MRFAGIKRGQVVADIMPGGGYFTRIFSKLVGPKGKVLAAIPEEFTKRSTKGVDDIKAIATSPAFANVVPVVSPVAVMTMPQPVDVAWTSNNYHDVYGYLGADTAAKLNTAVFHMLKPGGTYIVIDHAALPGTADTAPKTFHRIDYATVRAQVEAAGFVYDGESDALRQAGDPHDVSVMTPSLRGHSDQFVLKFHKPKK